MTVAAVGIGLCVAGSLCGMLAMAAAATGAVAVGWISVAASVSCSLAGGLLGWWGTR